MKLNRSNAYALHRPEVATALERGDKAIDALMDANTLRIGAREELAVQGDGLAHVYRLIEGWCARVRTLPDARVQIIAVYVPGDLLALKAMFLAEQPDSIYALSPATVALVDQARLRDAMLSNPDIAVRVAFQMTDEERRLHNRVVRLGQGNAAERVAAMLVVFRGRLVRAGMLDPKARHYRLPMTQVQISEFLGLTPVHVNRVFRRLREEKLATIGSGEVRFVDYEALARLASPVLEPYERTAAS
jgi:CRP/FNR family transcriptional regulator